MIKRLWQIIESKFFFKRRSGAVRFMFSTVFSLLAVLGMAAVITSETSYVRLETSDITIESGQRFSVSVYAYAHVPVNAIDITLNFDSTAVEVLEVDRGQSVLTIWTEDPVIENNKVILRGGTFKKGFLKEHKIADIDFKAKRTGQSSFNVNDVLLLAGDGAGTVVPLTEADDSTINFYVYDDNTNPEDIKVSVGVSIVTDIDGDGEVTLKDISAFMASWASRDKVYDFNNDGRMTFKDFSIILANFFF